MMQADTAKQFEHIHDHLRQHMQQLTGSEDTKGMELVGLIRMLANCYKSAISQNPESGELSGPRLGILLRLYGEEQMGNLNGINPTRLSHFQNVKKNTVSSLIRGLEDQGLVERTLDPVDKRVFSIRITSQGRELVKKTAPSRLQFMNQLAEGLTSEEQQQLIGLLEKLRSSMSCHPDFPK
jgi:DNA-binding MarR family transcriptional regulator